MLTYLRRLNVTIEACSIVCLKMKPEELSLSIVSIPSNLISHTKTIGCIVKFNVWLLACCLSVAFFCSPVSAAKVEDLYSAEIEVTGQGSDERAKAIRQALKRVVVKLTGSLQSTELPELNRFFEQASDYVEQFRYKEKKIQLSSQALAEQNTAGALGLLDVENAIRLNLWVSFDSLAVRSALDKANLAYWGQTRPLVLIWLAVEKGAGRFLLEKELHTELSSVLQGRADIRGLPIAFPLMDLEDRAVIGITDVWGNFADIIHDASQRYSVDAILVARLHQGNNAWQGRWTIYDNAFSHNWQSAELTLEALLKAGIDEATESIAQNYVQVMSNEGKENLQLAVYGLTNFTQYSQVLNYLTNLDVVQKTRVKEVSDKQVLLELELRGNLKIFEQTVQLGRVLERSNRLDVNHEQDDVILMETEEAQTKEIASQIDLFYRLAL